MLQPPETSLLNNHQNNNSKTFRIIHWNCNSIKSKDKLLELYLFYSQPDVVSLNEIKCDKFWAVQHLKILGYNAVFKCRESVNGSEVKGGGVAILLHKKHNVNEIDLNNNKE